MTQEIDTSRTAGAVEALKGLGKNLQDVVDQAPSTGLEPLLRLLKDGDWVYGPENLAVEENSTWAVNPLSVQHGYSCWTRYPDPKRKNELLGENMVSAGRPKPDKTALPEYRSPEGMLWEWNDQISAQLKCMSGVDINVQVLYKTSSVGGIRATTGLLQQVVDRLSKGETKVVPVIRLNRDYYDHKSYGRTYFPVFTVVDWLVLGGPGGGGKGMPEESAESAEAASVARRRALLTPEPARAPARAAQAESDPPWPARQRPQEAPPMQTPEAEPVRRRRRVL
jgi:hypothetical protein